MHCVELTGSDTRLDCGESFADPLNPLPRRCGTCGFPDLDHVPQPYRLSSSRAMTPDEAAPAAHGNFLVRGRVRRALDLAAPGACDFYPTVLGAAGDSPWALAVPRARVATATVKAAVGRCPDCGEPRSAHFGTQTDRWLLGVPWDAPHEAFKSANWSSSESGWDRWIDRGLYLSSRLYALLERLDVRGLDEAGGTAADRRRRAKDHKAWVDERAALLANAGVPALPVGTVPREVSRRFKKYLRRVATDGAPGADVRAAGRRLKQKLPASAGAFFAAGGPTAFHDVDGQPGFTARVLPPDRWEADAGGVRFATTDHGDCFHLAAAAAGGERPVLHYSHEANEFEPYADSFAACILRFAASE